MQNKGSAVDSAPFIFFIIPVGPPVCDSIIQPVSPWAKSYYCFQLNNFIFFLVYFKKTL